MHNSKPVLENETYRVLWDFVIETDHLIPACQPERVILVNNNTKILPNNGLYRPSGSQSKENQKRDKYRDLASGPIFYGT